MAMDFHGRDAVQPPCFDGGDFVINASSESPPSVEKWPRELLPVKNCEPGMEAERRDGVLKKGYRGGRRGCFSKFSAHNSFLFSGEGILGSN
ncbi:hypothetical protein HPP92_004243 [Vanilla planifolia]|uniref:Uncharacterized protein n=1 Tax=Vanilla planifolia TaxID=51239 RepID=A0A835VHY3_VANPL|nr:hypothetical protein HPP92_004243 [Vanilla planifolia]